MKTLIVGGVAGGATTAARLRRLNETAEIVIFEKGNYISFANCGLPYFIGDVIKQKKDLVLHTPGSFKNRFNIDVRLRQEVIDIDRENKIVTIKDVESGEQYIENYDSLVLSPGAEPINPFAFIKSEKIKTIRTIDDSVFIKKYIQENNPKSIAIIGGGYIGVEMAENLREYENIEISIIQKTSHAIPPIDIDIAKFVHEEIINNNIKLYLNEEVKDIKQKNDMLEVVLNNKIIETDFVIVSIGVVPDTKLAKKAALLTNSKGSIIVNEYMKTSDESIYTLGDAIQVNNFVTDMPAYIPLAGPANKQARVVANNICGRRGTFKGTVGSSILKIFEYNLGITGISEEICILNNIEYKTSIISPYSHATYYPGATQLTIKAIYQPKTGKILGAQVWGKDGVDKITDIIATAIRMKMTAFDLEELELCYAPPFSSAKSPVNILGNSIVNEIDELVQNISWSELEKLENPYILDVRTEYEYSYGHIKGSINIPVDELRENLQILDKNKDIYVHCQTGLRSYLACRILNQHGFNSKNIVGGFIMK